MKDRKVKVYFARFPYQNAEAPSVTDWFAETMLKAKKDKRIGEVFSKPYDDTPIYMTRNLSLVEAAEAGADVLCMIDSDMKPDLPLPGAKSFWDVAFDFWYSRRKDGPLVVAAPYCGPPPVENVYIFQWAKRQSDHPNVDFSLDQFSREDAAFRSGIEQVGALPTGLILIDLRAIDIVEPPWFDYEWTDKRKIRKASTEDVYFTRNASLAGVPVYVAWDCWAGHWKRKCVGKPTVTTVDDVRENLRGALARGMRRNERVVIMPPLSDEVREKLIRTIELQSQSPTIISRGDGHDGPAANGAAGLDLQSHHGGSLPDGDRPSCQEVVLAGEGAGI